MGCNANKKKMGSKKILKNYQLGCTLLEIMHTRAVTIGCPSNGCRASLISALHALATQTSAGGTACSLLPTAGTPVKKL